MALNLPKNIFYNGNNYNNGLKFAKKFGNCLKMFVCIYINGAFDLYNLLFSQGKIRKNCLSGSYEKCSFAKESNAN